MSSLLNTHSLDELRATLGEDLDMITQLFADQLGSELQRIHDCWAERDMQKLNRAAHALKGSSGNMGAAELSRIAAVIEKAALVPDEETLRDHVSRLDATAQATLDEMRQKGYLAGH